MRGYIFPVLVFLLLAGCQPAKERAMSRRLTEVVSSLYDPKMKPFYHGVASGDNLTDRFPAIM